MSAPVSGFAGLTAFGVHLCPFWTGARGGMAPMLAGTGAKPYLMCSLAALTSAALVFVLFGGGA